ncbi:MAG: hypothetical protein U0821_19335 [Chloroflexota bacterium]
MDLDTAGATLIQPADYAETPEPPQRSQEPTATTNAAGPNQAPAPGR